MRLTWLGSLRFLFRIRSNLNGNGKFSSAEFFRHWFPWRNQAFPIRSAVQVYLASRKKYMQTMRSESSFHPWGRGTTTRGLPFWVNYSRSGVETWGNAQRNQRASLRHLTLCFTFGGQAELLATSGCRQLKVKLKSVEDKYENVSSNCLGPDVGEVNFKSF